ncbi:hypothetical protein [Streptomyces silvensis]|uniref:Uncharacterized protein n=1 Tax=Streptomyces silvensis TaxID=1765722 RepID=A0A0W7X6M6_9ACTN|nr:hypothetical protein [Streptomyces silvensis]KUF18448.1 hypothetical protein AT728_19065 [Streptomyces silvensis]
MTRLSRAADRFATGSNLLTRRLLARAAAWCARGRRTDLTGWKAILGIIVRVLLLALGAYLAARIVRALPWLLWLLTGWWLCAAWRAARKAATDSPEETPAAAPATHSADDVRAATLEWLHDRIGDAQGVHLRDLLAHAQAHSMFEGLDVTTFRAHLERWDIPVRPRVRVRGKGVTVGIHRDDLQGPPAASPAPSGQETAEPQLHAS